jgi:hypothetical protein
MNSGRHDGRLLNDASRFVSASSLRGKHDSFCAFWLLDLTNGGIGGQQCCLIFEICGPHDSDQTRNVLIQNDSLFCFCR